MRKLYEPEPRFGDTRIRSKFLLTPMRINDEERWLEKASWKEVFKQIPGTWGLDWVAVEWVDNKDKDII